MHCQSFEMKTLINRLTFVGHFRLSKVVVDSGVNTQLPRATEQAVYKAQYTNLTELNQNRDLFNHSTI